MSAQVCEVLLEEVSAGRWRLAAVQGATLFSSREDALKWANKMANGRPLAVREPK